MDILIAYRHSDMFRLDNEYYQEKAKGARPFMSIDDRYDIKNSNKNQKSY